MTKTIFTNLFLAVLCSSISVTTANAQVTFTTPSNDEARAPRPPRERGPALEPALIAAHTAVETCAAKGYRVSVVVVDSAGLPVILLSGNGAAAITQSIAMGKAVSSVRNGKPSAELAEQARTDAELAANLAADPQQGPQRGGGIPIMAGSDVIGAIGVSGAPEARFDVECGQAGLQKTAIVESASAEADR
jgi:uncharacterized protein GlcG (DUF336 family)